MTSSHPDVDALLARTPRTHFLAGAFVDAAATLPVENPATGEVLAHVADGDVNTARRALDAAAAAQPAWAATPPRERADVLWRAYELTVQRTDDLATLMTLEMGKPLAEARGEVAYAADFLRWFAEEAVRVTGRWNPAPSGAHRILVSRRPVGPVLAITPWNFPLAMATRKVAPALAAGCTIVVKPAEATPLTMLTFAAILAEAGVPGGVVNVFTTADPGAPCAALLADPRLRKLTFTGSTVVGRALLAQASEQVLRTSMELGGNAPFLVLADADVAAAVDAAMLAKFRNGGEACTAANRFLVHESVAAEFTARFVERVAALVPGNGLDPATTLGPLIDADAVAKAGALVDDAVARGARIALRHEGCPDRGHFYPPTVLVDVPGDARILREEVFAPVAPLQTFTDLDDAVARANDTELGLVSYLFTRDLATGLAVGERLQAGMVGLNTGLVSNAAAPFGGVKQSGLGREGGAEGLEQYLETHYTAVAGL